MWLEEDSRHIIISYAATCYNLRYFVFVRFVDLRKLQRSYYEGNELVPSIRI